MNVSNYFQVLSHSNFTICPGGDREWSMRFYEAILAKSIPVIHNFEDDMSDCRFEEVRWIGYHYLTLDMPLVYHPEWADQNLRLFLKYQTFIFGDRSYDGPKGRWDDMH